MKKRNNKHEKRVKRLIVCCGLCAVILSVSTYAWFIGMKTVNVSSFDVEIAAIDSLSLSLNGLDFGDTVTINKENHKTASYEGNTNSWGGDAGLIPMSSVGKINQTSSRMTLFEKGSLTASHGGYRLMASEVQNSGATEANGYVAFDLFIKNLSGNAYYTDLTKDNEEAIYLTPESKVTVATGGVQNTGIENSVRVAFTQIGRVKAPAVHNADSAAKITGITCATAGDVTGICANRDAQIWEPNDKIHIANAINWYETSCQKRTGANLTLKTAYSGTFGDCGKVEHGKAYNTYAVSGVITELNNVDVYDGADYNGYEGSTATSAQAGKLVAYDYFTDTEKHLEGTARPELLTLAPNSVTKVRIYIWIEGQDVDNYDFASLGQKISVAFGFTKERYYGEDVDYDGNPELPDNRQERPVSDSI